eukprot:74329-Pelagomonas_calceolata.AAC.2
MSTKLLKRSLNSILHSPPPPAGSTSAEPTPPSAAPSQKARAPSKQVLKRQAAKEKKRQALERAAQQSAELTKQRNLRWVRGWLLPACTQMLKAAGIDCTVCCMHVRTATAKVEMEHFGGEYTGCYGVWHVCSCALASLQLFPAMQPCMQVFKKARKDKK